MSVRPAIDADLALVEGLWRAFEAEVPAPSHVQVDHEVELREIREIVADGLAFVAEEGGEPIGLALARMAGPALGRLTDLYVVPAARRRGAAAELAHAAVDALAARGATHVDLEVSSANAGARAVYQRWGFVEETIRLVAPLEPLRERLEPGHHAFSFASIHVQTDDVGDVQRAAEAFAPRVGSAGTRVEGPRNGWTAIYDTVTDEDPTALVRFAREVSSRMGAVVVALSLEVDQVVRLVALDRGGIVDEYLSVPEFYGPLPPGDVIGLAANPTVLQRLTGADPQAIRDIARNAAAPSELPPPRELLAALAGALGIEGADHGYAGADSGLMDA